MGKLCPALRFGLSALAIAYLLWQMSGRLCECVRVCVLVVTW